MLRGHRVYCFGERRLDLATRLDYAEVDYVVVDDDASLPPSKETVSLLANYTAFTDWLEVRTVTTICVLYPDLLGTYGDGGNGLAIAERARRRGVDVDLVSVGLGDEVPDASLYLLGGGEDGPQRLAADLLRTSSFASACATAPTCSRSAPDCRFSVRRSASKVTTSSRDSVSSTCDRSRRAPFGRRARDARRRSTARRLREPRRTHHAARRGHAARAPSSRDGATTARSTATARRTSGPRTRTARCSR